MTNVIPFPENKKQRKINLIKLVFCKHCLKKRCPDISNKKSGVIAMLVPVLDENKNPFHAYVTIGIRQLNEIFAEDDKKPFVDLTEYATIHYISEGFEPKSDFTSGYFNKNNSKSIETFH